MLDVTIPQSNKYAVPLKMRTDPVSRKDDRERPYIVPALETVVASGTALSE